LRDREIRILALFTARVLFGQERANIETLAALRDAGCVVLCLVREEDWPEVLDIRRRLTQSGLDWIKTPQVDYPLRGWLMNWATRSPRALLGANRNFLRVVAAFRPTHIHAFSPVYVAGLAWALRKCPAPLIYRCGDAPVLHNLFYRMAWRFIVRRTSRFVADSRFIARKLCGSGVEPGKVRVVYGPPPRRADLAPVVLPAPSLAPGAFRIVYVGQIREAKGVGVLVDALRALAWRRPQAHLLIAGRISDWRGDDWARALRDAAGRDAALRERVHFLGFVENVPDLMRSSHLHVAPTLTEEPYGLVVVEAKAQGIASVIFESGGMSELVEDGVDGARVHPKTPSALCAALETYLANPTLAGRHGAAAKDSLVRLGTGDYGRRWLEVYESA
jgi:glycosyltransferase involved in cell wall biosynthesis